ncbi:unnamed protein product, partial [Urochloa humidicola]
PPSPSDFFVSFSAQTKHRAEQAPPPAKYSPSTAPKTNRLHTDLLHLSNYIHDQAMGAAQPPRGGNRGSCVAIDVALNLLDEMY